MAFSRYRSTPQISGGQQLATSTSISSLRQRIKSGQIAVVNRVVLSGRERLDTLAGIYYGDAKYWWVIAAASGIGWGLQVPAGTVINIINLKDVEGYVS